MAQQIPIQQALAQAVQHHRAGRFSDAEAIYRQVLAVNPHHPDALHLLGVLGLQVGQVSSGLELIDRAVALDPNSPVYRRDLGKALHAAGQQSEAIAAFEMVTKQAPDLVEAWIDLGNALQIAGRLQESLAPYHRALERDPRQAMVHNNLGSALTSLGRLEEALEHFRIALEIEPSLPQAWCNLGDALRRAGDFEKSLEACDRAVELAPRSADSHNNLGNALRSLGRLDEAAAAYRKAISINPATIDGWGNLAGVLHLLGDLQDAAAACKRALELKDDVAITHNTLGNVLKDLGLLDQAMDCYRKAVMLDPDEPLLQSNLIYAAHFHPGYDMDQIAIEERRWNERFAQPRKKFARPHQNQPDPDRRLRIGYISPNFNFQAECFFVVPLLESHDHAQVEVHCYSDVRCTDEITDRLVRCADGWHNVLGWSDEKLGQQIRDDRIDILIDLTMHMRDPRMTLYPRKPAPVQVAWLAYPGSTGLDCIDYRLTDAYMDPPDHGRPSWSSEEPVRLPDCWCCYEPVDGNPDRAAELPAKQAGHITFGCLNHPCKVNRFVLDLWTEVLNAVGGSRLLLLMPPSENRERISSFFVTKGIDSQRIEYLNTLRRQDYLRQYDRIDVALDPFPYNGITTTCDALWMGVPVLTLPGQTPMSRAGSAMLNTVGLADDLVGKNPQQLIGLIRDLTGDLPKLAAMRRSLPKRMKASALMDYSRFARSVESAYRQMWRNWCADVPHIPFGE